MPKHTAITEEWDGRYNTNIHAESVETRHGESVLAIRIEHGHLRGSDFAGIFEVADVPNPFDVNKDGELRVECKVGWFFNEAQNHLEQHHHQRSLPAAAKLHRTSCPQFGQKEKSKTSVNLIYA